MSGAGYEPVVHTLAMVLTGVVVKIMDDYLDMEFDLHVGKKTLAVRWGRACLPYALLVFGLAMALAPGLSFALFAASYAIGMGHVLSESMPSRLPGWLESLAVIGMAVGTVGWKTAVWALLAVFSVQLIDDVIDREPDGMTGQANIARRIGTIEALLLLLAATLCSALLMPLETVEMLLALPLVFLVLDVLKGLAYGH
jgi:4-hydroxybenzoate polyprenyltransferase